MTVAELIEVLQYHQQDLQVVCTYAGVNSPIEPADICEATQVMSWNKPPVQVLLINAENYGF